MSPKKVKQIKENHAKMVAVWRKRKRMCNDIVDQVCVCACVCACVCVCVSERVDLLEQLSE